VCAQPSACSRPPAAASLHTLRRSVVTLALSHSQSSPKWARCSALQVHISRPSAIGAMWVNMQCSSSSRRVPSRPTACSAVTGAASV